MNFCLIEELVYLIYRGHQLESYPFLLDESEERSRTEPRRTWLKAAHVEYEHWIWILGRLHIKVKQDISRKNNSDSK